MLSATFTFLVATSIARYALSNMFCDTEEIANQRSLVNWWMTDSWKSFEGVNVPANQLYKTICWPQRG